MDLEEAAARLCAADDAVEAARERWLAETPGDVLARRRLDEAHVALSQAEIGLLEAARAHPAVKL